MGRLNEILTNTNDYLLLFCVVYSFFGGVIFPEIWNVLYNRERRSRYAVVQLIKSLGTWGLAVLICTLPGTILAWTVHKDYGGASLLLFFIGGAVRRILHETKEDWEDFQKKFKSKIKE